MTVQRAVTAMAGFMVLLSLALGHFTGQIDISQPSWLWLTVFVGLNLFQSSFTGFCPAAKIFKAMGLKDLEGSCG